MSILEQIEKLRVAVSGDATRCAITFETPDEAVLHGTQAGLTKMALALLEAAYGCEDPGEMRIRDNEGRMYSSSVIASAIYSLPIFNQVGINSIHVYDDPTALVKHLSAIVDPQLPNGARLTNDPLFEELYTGRHS